MTDPRETRPVSILHPDAVPLAVQEPNDAWAGKSCLLDWDRPHSWPQMRKKGWRPCRYCGALGYFDPKSPPDGPRPAA